MAWYTPATDWLFGSADDASSDAAARQQAATEAYTAGVDTAMKPYAQLTDVNKTKKLQTDYVSGLENLDTDQYRANAAQLDTGNVLGDVSSYLDPSIDAQMKAATRSVESSQAGKGGLFSGAAGNEIASKTQEIAEQGYGDAYSRANQAQQQANAAKLQQQNATQNAGTYNLGLDTTGVNATGTALDTMMSPLGTLTQAQLDKLATVFGAESGLGQQQLQGQLSDTGHFSELLSAAATVAGSQAKKGM